MEKVLKVGTITKFTVDKVSFDVKIVATRKRVKQEYLLEPVSGKGQGWFGSFSRNTKTANKK